MSLSDRVRPDVEAAPWVVKEIQKLEAERDAAEKLLMQALDEIPDGRVKILNRIEKHIRKMQARGGA